MNDRLTSCQTTTREDALAPKSSVGPTDARALKAAVLLRNYGAVIGALEVTALLLAGLLAVLVRARPALFYLATGAATCLALMIAIWAVWINGINKTVNSWTRDSLPSNWAELRDRWHVLHAVRLALGLLGLGALIILALRLGRGLRRRGRWGIGRSHRVNKRRFG